jgi:hypothetical protein
MDFNFIVARQRLDEYTAATNTDVTIEELLKAWFPLRFVLFEGKLVLPRISCLIL